MSKQLLAKEPAVAERGKSIVILGSAIFLLTGVWIIWRIWDSLLRDDQWDVDLPPLFGQEGLEGFVIEGPSSLDEMQAVDDLTLIHGIGPGYATRLHSAEIVSYADLAQLDDEEFDRILDRKEFQQLDYESWRQQARKLDRTDEAVSGGDDLTIISGIGATYATKLRDAGIDSFARLAETTPEQLDAILEPPEWRKPDYKSWIFQAIQLEP